MTVKREQQESKYKQWFQSECNRHMRASVNCCSWCYRRDAELILVENGAVVCSSQCLVDWTHFFAALMTQNERDESYQLHQ